MENTDIVLNHKLFNEKLNKIEDDEKTRVFCKHNLSHLMDVARICYIQCLEENLLIDKDLIYVTALLHDLGRADEIDTGINHNILSVKIAEEILKDLKFDDKSKSRILNAIKYHRYKIKNKDRFVEIFYKSDKLSRMCFRCPANRICNWSSEKKNRTVIY
ncbi:HD domain-containing protein [uncultured Finegoldia sp.]|uniref:HD domain-containing protein n=1 Tax=uncultured Finegoldia sp. TaxID=328009 RepID=UPI00261E089E|nr:HD domain-containing protein [uncultured Finegoldia sp.]